MNNQYYVIHSQNTGNYPMVTGKALPKLRYYYSDDFRDEKGDIMLINNRIECKLAPEDYKYDINLAKPVPAKPEFVDFHMYDLEHSVSTKFVEEFEGFPGIQFLQGTHGEVIEELKLDYYYIHYLCAIKCMDLEKSEALISRVDGRIKEYEKLILDNKILDNIPEEQRLIFWLWEDPMTCIVHQKFVDKYNASDLKGARFVPIEQYNEESTFM